MRWHFRWIYLSILLAISFLFTGCSLEQFQDFYTQMPTEEELAAKIPKLDMEKYNQFQFDLKINVGNEEEEEDEITESGSVELYKNISHLYNHKRNVLTSGTQITTESWTNFNTKNQYENTGDGWVMSSTEQKAIDNFVNVINNRNTDRILDLTDSVCTLSWQFDTDLNALFGELLSPYTEDMNLKGNGRATAVFDRKTYELKQFTFVITANNASGAGALLDANFYWMAINDHTIGLCIPSDVMTEAYKNTTGIVTTDGYDAIINPMAETLAAIGGAAEIVHDTTGSSLFWTIKENDVSTTVNYIKTGDFKSKYEETYEFFRSVYGKSVEETDNEAYFYDAKSGELTYMAKGEDWYGEIIITGESGISQGELRKSLINYRSKLNI